MQQPTREQALEVLLEYNKNESLVKHALAVEGVMRHFASLFDEDADKWGIVGLIHDLDYEMYPEQHCTMTRTILEERGWPEEYIRAAVSHGYGICCDVEPLTNLEKTLYTIDELTGLIAAAALVRPSRSVLDIKVSSVKKKWKTKAFAAGVDRGLIEQGAERLEMPLDEVIKHTIDGMRNVAEEIGLKGSL